MTRVLPGVYGSIFDNSQLPEGQGVLTVGYALACKKGTVGEPFLVVSPTDFLEKTTFSGKPPINGDPTYTTILKVLQQTNQVYISRVATNPLYGGLVVKRDFLLGDVAKIEDISEYDAQTGEVLNPLTKITLIGQAQVDLVEGNIVRLYGTDTDDGRYKVIAIETVEGNTEITVSATLNSALALTGLVVELYKTQQPLALNKELIGEIKGIDNDVTIERLPYTELHLAGNVAPYALQGDQVRITGSGEDDGLHIVYDAQYDEELNETIITLKGKLPQPYIESTGTVVELYRDSIADPESYKFKEEDLFLICGKDQGAYNGDIQVNIISTAESPELLAESDTMQITVYNAQSGQQLGNSFLCSRDESARSIAGEPLYIEQVINGNSEYIRVLNNTLVDETLLPCNTVQPVTDNEGNITGYMTGDARLGGGSDGETIYANSSTAFISALEGFKDKTIPVSILGNGWCEENDYQQTLLSIAEDRLDCFAFLNSRKVDEQSPSNGTKATNIVKYKKGVLGSTTYMATMYAPHVTAVDTLNQRKVELGAEAVAIPGWLGIINTKGYPYAYAGYDDGAVTGVTTKWKIGDQSGEAQTMNDASVNYIAYDARDGVYYMQCQNTLQIANSALRNVGTVLNILDIKETFMRYFKPFIQKPITPELRGLILDGGRQQVKLYVDQRRITNGVLQDVSTDLDISNNTLRYILTIAPTPYAQVIYLVMNIVNQTYDFSILQSA